MHTTNLADGLRLALARHSPLSLAATTGQTLSYYRFGRNDPTTRLEAGEFWRATYTPDGPATLHIDFRGDELRSQAWGPGGDWMLQRVGAMTGANDPGYVFTEAHPAITSAQRDHPRLRFGASFTLYHELLPTVLGQRVTGGEAVNQWRALVQRLGDAAPGPTDLRLPPAPDALAAQPAWWFHPIGIEAKRAEPLRQLGKHASKLWQWAELAPTDAAAKLALLPGIGAWTIGSALGSALGDADSVAVGDFHLKNIVGYALAGRARSTDEEMLRLLEPYRGQRGRVVRLLLAAGHTAPKFGPRQRVLPMNRW
ncbi:MAG: DNA-3-methyladenine glycosylase 2 family protein [Actinomycetia bacterium]|nr:DNA-3-methyladenine glycosylase 2 family protein [Actinomycetes bacterium]